MYGLLVNDYADVFDVVSLVQARRRAAEQLRSSFVYTADVVDKMVAQRKVLTINDLPNLRASYKQSLEQKNDELAQKIMTQIRELEADIEKSRKEAAAKATVTAVDVAYIEKRKQEVERLTVCVFFLSSFFFSWFRCFAQYCDRDCECDTQHEFDTGDSYYFPCAYVCVHGVYARMLRCMLCMHACMYVCMYVFMYVCMYVCHADGRD
jgi:hypothetical protein